jgi:hypothetical protein
VEQVLPDGRGVGASGREEEVRKGCGRVNAVQILCKHVFKWKNDIFETIPGMGEGVIKENNGRDEFKYDIFEML